MKPSDLYLGVSALFSIVVPGFLVTVVVIFLFRGTDDAKTINTFAWTVLAVASYIVGHILFAIGSLWDELYDSHKPEGNEPLLEKIGDIRTELIGAKDCNAIKKYKWSRSVLSKEHPEGYQEVLRKEADSKLFRSLILPLIILAIYLLVNANWVAASISLVSAITVYYRFRKQRFQACQLAYTHIITLASRNKI